MADKLDRTTEESLENARRNAGIPVTSGDLGGTSVHADYVDESVAERGTTDPQVHTTDTDTGGETEKVPRRLEDRSKEQLQAQLEKAGKSTSGSKSDLIARIRGDD